MEAGTELVPRRVQERVARSELLEAHEHVVAYVSGRSKLEVTGSVRADLCAALPGNVRSFRAVILTDRRLYICSIKFGLAGALKSVLSTHKRGGYSASIRDTGDPQLWLHVENESIATRTNGWIRHSAEVIVAAASPSRCDA